MEPFFAGSFRSLGAESFCGACTTAGLRLGTVEARTCVLRLRPAPRRRPFGSGRCSTATPVSLGALLRLQRLRGVCLERRVPYHRLQRRAIENYLPVRALEAWAYLGTEKVRTPRRRAVAAFASMSEAHRHHYNMKGGFERDRRDPSAGIPELYGELADHKDLQSGFANDIAVLFQERDFPIREEWLAKDGHQQETLDMVQSIFRHL
jgi:hypothetical protein